MQTLKGHLARRRMLLLKGTAILAALSLSATGLVQACNGSGDQGVLTSGGTQKPGSGGTCGSNPAPGCGCSMPGDTSPCGSSTTDPTTGAAACSEGTTTCPNGIWGQCSSTYTVPLRHSITIGGGGGRLSPNTGRLTPRWDVPTGDVARARTPGAIRATPIARRSRRPRTAKTAAPGSLATDGGGWTLAETLAARRTASNLRREPVLHRHLRRGVDDAARRPSPRPRRQLPGHRSPRSHSERRNHQSDGNGPRLRPVQRGKPAGRTRLRHHRYERKLHHREQPGRRLDGRRLGAVRSHPAGRRRRGGRDPEHQHPAHRPGRPVAPPHPGHGDGTCQCQRHRVRSPSRPFRAASYNQDNIPHIGVVTGSCDPFECLLNDMGIDRSQFSTFGGGGRVELMWSLQQRNHGDRQRTVNTSGNQPAAIIGLLPDGGLIDAATSGYAQMLGNAGTTNNYDMIMLPCRCSDEYEDKTEDTNDEFGYRQGVVNYANAGGKVFTSHWGREWIERPNTSYDAGPPLCTQASACTGTDQPSCTSNVDCSWSGSCSVSGTASSTCPTESSQGNCTTGTGAADGCQWGATCNRRRAVRRPTAPRRRPPRTCTTADRRSPERVLVEQAPATAKTRRLRRPIALANGGREPESERVHHRGRRHQRLHLERGTGARRPLLRRPRPTARARRTRTRTPARQAPASPTDAPGRATAR